MGRRLEAIDRYLAVWLASAGVTPPRLDDGGVSAGDPALAAVASALLREPWPATLASDAPYLELLVRLGHPRTTGRLWAAATRRGSRFQVEMVASLPALPPLHVIARDPPEGVTEILPPGHEAPVSLRRSVEAVPPAAPPATLPNPDREGGDRSRNERPDGPPAWDEPGPCDCGVPPDLCAMKRFRLPPAAGATPSALPGADIFRQLSAAIVDLHEVRDARVPGILPGDRVLVARSPESLAALAPDDTVLDARSTALPAAEAEAPIVGSPGTELEFAL